MPFNARGVQRTAPGGRGETVEEINSPDAADTVRRSREKSERDSTGISVS
jgi:hypothetical protein